MDRIKITEQRLQEIYGELKTPVVNTNPDFDNILHSFLMGDVWSYGNLTDRQRMLVTITAMTATKNQNALPVQVEAAMNMGLTPVEITEIFHQIAPYIGFPDAMKGLVTVNQVFVQKAIQLPLPSQSTTTEENRSAKGLQVQKDIFGEDNINKMQTAAPERQKHIQEYLSAFCFGDTYTRDGLNLQDREMLTMVVLACLGGCEPQLKGHIQGNINIGNSKETLLGALTQCIPFIGFPRTLNAVSCLNEVVPEKQ